MSGTSGMRGRDAVQAERLARAAMLQLGWDAEELIVASSFCARLLGMGGVAARDPDAATVVLAFPDCRSVHTCFMAFPIDIAFVDAHGRALSRHTVVPPWRFLSEPGASMVLERAALPGPGTPLPAWCRSAQV